MKNLLKQVPRNSKKCVASFLAQKEALAAFSQSSYAMFSVKSRFYGTATTLDNSLDTFARRHNSQIDLDTPGQASSIQAMLKTVGVKSVEELISKTIPASIFNEQGLQELDAKFGFKKNLGREDGEHDVLAELRDKYAKKNKIYKSYIGMGYYNTLTPNVILRNVLESPAWYTPYTPYQAEISQGRLESLLNYQTMVADLTGMQFSNASLLDEATAAAEAVNMAYNIFLSNHKSLAKENKKVAFVVSKTVHPQTIDVINTRAEPFGIHIEVVDDVFAVDYLRKDLPICGVLVQYPSTEGSVSDYSNLVNKVHENGAIAVFATDLLALTLLKSPGEFDADIAIGTNQRFGIPMGYGGPHAGFLACREAYKRNLPGRLIGVSRDAQGKRALRMSLQTREQHIRRDKATSNICTAQALLSNISAFYAIYHGPQGLKKIANNIHEKASLLATALKNLDYAIFNQEKAVFFDTIRVDMDASKADTIMKRAYEHHVNLRRASNKSITISLDETTSVSDLELLVKIFNVDNKKINFSSLEGPNVIANSPYARKSAYLTHPVFNSYQTEHELLRYIYRLQSRDISLCHSMIPLGSCTMKLNATAEMIPVTWPEFGQIHPFAPVDQTQGYQQMFRDLENWLAYITGFDAVSLQPNSGAQGEYTGLMVIRKYLQTIGQGHRDICLIPTSAHGTNPASAAMAAMKVVVVKCDKNGNVDVDDLLAKAEQYKDNLAALMITYPSTHGVFEESVKMICDTIHKYGGQVYMDGANMNAQVGLTSPGLIGADVCHLNLHKTFCIPHGGGGPGMGPICVRKHLAPHFPTHVVIPEANKSSTAIGAVSAAPWGSSSILPISWMYIRMMGGEGLRRATQIAILNANYMAKRLESHYKIYYRGATGLVAHEFILDINPFKQSAGVEAEDIAKRLMDYGFHAPTMSFPIANTLMIEPTESESKEEMDRLCDALISIRQEIREIEEGKADRKNNVLKHAPHTADVVTSDKWDRPYSRQKAAYPAPWTQSFKLFPYVSRIDNVYGDQNLICSCPPIESYQKE